MTSDTVIHIESGLENEEAVMALLNGAFPEAGPLVLELEAAFINGFLGFIQDKPVPEPRTGDLLELVEEYIKQCMDTAEMSFDELGDKMFHKVRAWLYQVYFNMVATIEA